MHIQHFCPKEIFSDEASAVLAAGDYLGRAAGESILNPAKLAFFQTELFAIYDRDALLLVPTLFLAAKSSSSNGMTHSTPKTYAESLLPWLRHLQQTETELADVSEETFTTYRSSIKNSKLSSSTRYLRLSVPCYLHKWAHSTGAAPSPFGQYLKDRDDGFHADGGRPLVTRRSAKQPRYVEHEHWNILKGAAAQPLRLMFEWAVATGIRGIELCALTVGQLSALEVAVAAKPTSLVVPLEILRKGGNESTIQVPVILVNRTSNWSAMHRPAPKDDRADQFVFLSTLGKPFKRDCLSHAFRRCADLAGSTATLHHLRHTFAINVLTALSVDTAKMNINPMKLLQGLLGHRDAKTTEIYLQAFWQMTETIQSAIAGATYEV